MFFLAAIVRRAAFMRHFAVFTIHHRAESNEENEQIKIINQLNELFFVLQFHSVEEQAVRRAFATWWAP